MHAASWGWYVAPLLAVASLSAGAQDTRLVDAAKASDATSVGRLLDQGIDANARQPDGATALHWAAHWDDIEMADALLRAGAAVDVTNDFGVTPLWLACLNGNAPMIESLLTAGANAKTALPSGETALMTASRTGSETAVKLLLTHGANVNAQEHSRGQTALMWAVAQQHPDVVKTLIELGANVRARSDTRPRRIHTRTAGFEPTGVIDITQGGYTPMLFAARQGNVDVARHLVAAGGDVNDVAPSGTSALVVAAHSGGTALASFLLEQGADPNAVEAGYSALHGATLRGDEVLAKALLAAGADPDTPVTRGSPGRRNSPDYVLEHDVVGATAFWLAASFAEPVIMRALVDNGATPHSVMEDGTTPLMAATRARRRIEPGLTPNPIEDEKLVMEAARVAIDAGNDVNATDTAGNTALHAAASRRLSTVVQLLADSGANLNAQNEEGQTPLAMAVGSGRTENSTAALLRRLGAEDR